jgi:hypothetical protein
MNFSIVFFLIALIVVVFMLIEFLLIPASVNLDNIYPDREISAEQVFN